MALVVVAFVVSGVCVCVRCVVVLATLAGCCEGVPLSVLPQSSSLSLTKRSHTTNTLVTHPRTPHTHTLCTHSHTRRTSFSKLNDAHLYHTCGVATELGELITGRTCTAVENASFCNVLLVCFMCH